VDAPFPVIEHLPVELDDHDRHRAETLARALLDTDPMLASVDHFGMHLGTGVGSGLNLFIEDHHSIRLFEVLGNQAYSYRALLLAGSGDLVVIGRRRSIAFEDYCARTLGLGDAEIVQPASTNGTNSLAARSAADSVLITDLAERARAYGEINIIPYMGSGSVWALAGSLAARSGLPVRVCAPPPRLTRCVNDKIWFNRCADRLMGNEAVPPALPASGSAMLASRVAQLARNHATVAIKLPDSASSKGNYLFDAASLTHRSLSALREQLLKAMRRSGWQGDFPVLVSAWEDPVLASPSVHLWIPDPSMGDPIVEAVFEQRIVGSGGEFGGASPSTLPWDWQRRLAREAAMMGVLFQRLGYFGRCSFDAILVGTEPGRATLHWIECNGRWGGVSMPMTLAARLFGDWQQRPFVIREESNLGGRPQNLTSLLEALDGELFVSGGSPVGTVILTPFPLEMGSGYDIMAFDDDLDAAGERAARVGARLRQLLQGGDSS
jgi:hypothetical protein